MKLLCMLGLEGGCPIIIQLSLPVQSSLLSPSLALSLYPALLELINKNNFTETFIESSQDIQTLTENYPTIMGKKI